MQTHILNQNNLTFIFNLLPENKKQQLIDFATFLLTNTNQKGETKPEEHSLKAVEETWGSIPLSRDILKYIAESKELEYEF